MSYASGHASPESVAEWFKKNRPAEVKAIRDLIATDATKEPSVIDAIKVGLAEGNLGTAYIIDTGDVINVGAVGMDYWAKGILRSILAP